MTREFRQFPFGPDSLPTEDRHLVNKQYADNLVASGAISHNDLSDKDDDDHPHYFNQTRGDARYYTQSQVDAIRISLQNEIDTDIATHHDAASTDHDDRYYTEAEVDALIYSVPAGTDNRLVRYDGTDDLQESIVSLSDTGVATGFTDLTSTTLRGNTVSLGPSADLTMSHAGSFGNIQNNTGNLDIITVAGSELGLRVGTTDAILIDAAFKVTLAGNLDMGSNRHIYLGASDTTDIYDTGSALILRHTGSSNFTIDQMNAAGSIQFRTGATPTAALTLASDQTATFASDVYLGDADALVFGDGNDVTMQWNASNFIIQTPSAGSVYIDGYANVIMRTGDSQTTALTLDNSQNATFVGNILLGDNDYIRLGAAPDMDIFHTGAYGQIDNNTGGLYIDAATGESIVFRVGATLSATMASDQVWTFTELPVTPSEAPSTDYQVANKKYVDDAVSGGGGLDDWTEDASGHLYPNGASQNLGSATNEIQHIYLKDNGTIYLGSDQDIEIKAGSTSGSIIPTSDDANNFYIGTLANSFGTVGIRVVSSFEVSVADTKYFEIEADGEIRIDGDGTRDAAYCLTMGADQDMQIYYAGGTTGGFIDVENEQLNIRCLDNYAIFFNTNNTYRWLFRADGHLAPYAADTYDIGTTAAEVRNIYVGDAGALYFGLAQDVRLDWNNTSGYFMIRPVSDEANHMYLGTAANQFTYVYVRAANGLNVAANDDSGFAAVFFNDGNALTRYGIEVESGIDTPTGSGTENYVIHASDGNGSRYGYVAHNSGDIKFLQASDRRFKTSISDADFSALDLINALQLRNYTFRSYSEPSPKVHLGFIAQEVQAVIPDIVAEAPDRLYDMKGMDTVYTEEEADALEVAQGPPLTLDKEGLIPYLVKAVQELSAEITTLKLAR